AVGRQSRGSGHRRQARRHEAWRPSPPSRRTRMTAGTAGTDHLKAYEGQTVLVTGGAGAIGSNLSRALVGAGARVIVLDNLSSAERWNIPSLPGLLFVEGDIRDEVILKRVFF